MNTSQFKGLLISIVLLFGSVSTASAGPDEMAMPMGNSAMSDKSMNDELVELRAKVARLEAALEKNHRGGKQDAMQMGMGMKGMKDGMGMMDMGRMKMGGDSKQMAMGGGSGMMGMKMMGMMHGKSGMMDGGIGMMNMGEMPQSALPGFPGISHIYHIGATGFLDHAEHVGLTAEQKENLGKVKAKSEKAQEDFEDKIMKTEKNIWGLTGSDEPNIEAITNKVKEIEQLRADKRISFIKAVGEAATLLTNEQRELLVNTKDGASDPHASHKH